MDLTGIKSAVEELEKTLPEETAQLFNRFDLSVQQLISGLDQLLTKHEGNLVNFLDGFEISISFKRKGQQ